VSIKNSTNVTISNLSLDGAPKGSTTANWIELEQTRRVKGPMG